MEINTDGVSIAVEVKKGKNGSAVRQGFGQCVIYSSKYDFIVFLFVDTSDDKRILNSMGSEKEENICKSIWHNYNAMFRVV